MARIGYGDYSMVPPEVREALGGQDLLNVFRMMLHSPQVMGAAATLGAWGLACTELQAPSRELLILACGVRFQADYEWDQHEPISRSVGVTDEQRAAVRRGDLDAECFTAQDRALLRFTGAVAVSPAVSDVEFAAVRAHFNDRQLVEAVMLTGYYFMLGRVATIFEVDSDPRGDDAVLAMATKASA